MKRYFHWPILLLAATLFFGCDNSSTGADKEETARLVLIEDLDATGADGHYTFFDLDDSTTVADSSSVDWDLAFKSTTILVNSGQSGPGTARAAVYTGVFDDIRAVPGDAEWKSGGGVADPAIPSGSGSGWYNYSGPPNHLITPLPGRVIIVETSEGNFAKLRILSYYKGNPAEAGATDARFYTFEYVLTADGGMSFE